MNIFIVVACALMFVNTCALLKAHDLLLPFDRMPIGSDKLRVSLVHVSQVSRTVRKHSREPTGENRAIVALLTYRIEEVLNGDPAIVGRIATTQAHEGSMISYSPFRHSCWIPPRDDRGIWLVYESNAGDLVCLSASPLGVPFPVYESGVHNKWEMTRVSFESVLSFGRMLDEVQLAIDKDGDVYELVKHALKSSNEYSQRWAAWYLGEVRHPGAYALLKEMCLQNAASETFQGFADRTLLALQQGSEWKSSHARQQMIGRWLSLDDDEF